MLGMDSNSEMNYCGSVKRRGAGHGIAGRVDERFERYVDGEGRMCVLAAYCGCAYFVGYVLAPK